jgi:hypothetical protein
MEGICGGRRLMAMPSAIQEGGTTMRRPDVAGLTLQALEPLVQKLTELETQALRGDSMSVVTLGAVLATTLATVGRSAMELVIQQAARAHGPGQVCTCGKQAKSKGFERTSFVARFGRVKADRRRNECVCGRSWFAFDEAWGFPAGEYADDVREAAERLAIRLASFDEAVDELNYLWGVAPDGSTAKRWVARDGTRADLAVKADAQAHWKEYEKHIHAVAQGELRAQVRHDGFGVVELDGVHALTWRPGQEPRRRKADTQTEKSAASPHNSAPALASESSERASRHQAQSTLSEVQGSPMGPTGRSPRVRGREVCVGLAYLGEDACEESPGRGALLDRRYVATLNDREGFWLKLHAAATAQGVLSCQKVVRVSDGGSYFIEQSNELFSDQPLVPILDCQHVKQHVWEAGHKVLTDKKAVPAWVLPRTQAIMDGLVDTVIGDLAHEKLKGAGTCSAAAIDELSGYLCRHKHMMDYPKYKAAGYPIASAAIESTNKRLVGRRCKQGGMIWSEPGLEAMVAMRVAFYNPGAWKSLWPHSAPAAA